MHQIELKDKEYFFPENVEEMSLGLYEKVWSEIIKRNQEEDFSYDEVITIVSIITGIEKQLILDSPPGLFDYLLKLTKWVFDIDLKQYPIKSEIEINNEIYYYQESPNVSLKEWADLDFVLKNFPDENKHSGAMAIRVRKKIPNHITGNAELEKYNSEILEKRMHLFKQVKVTDAFPLINFFLTKENLLLMLTRSYSGAMELAQMQWEQNEDLLKNGAGGRQLSRLQKMMFRKLNRSFQSILKQYSLFSPILLTKLMPKSKPNKNEELENSNQNN